MGEATKHMTYGKPNYLVLLTALLFAPTGCDTDGDLGNNSTDDSESSDDSGTAGPSSGAEGTAGATTAETSGPVSGSTTGGSTPSGTTTGGDPPATTDATESGGTATSESSTGSDEGTGSSGSVLPYPECLEPLLMPALDALGPACTEFLIIEYTFQGQSVFVLDSSQCGFFDQFFPVFTEDCELLCNLYGFAGTTVCNGEEFYDNAVELDSWPYPG